MPRFYFDVRTPSGVVCLDHEGLDCADASAALAEARHGARFVEPEEGAGNPLFSGYRFSVADEAHRFLFTVPFTELEIDGAVPPAPIGRGAPAKRARHLS
ncbi:MULTISPECIES: DUF6894 family protein [Methylobacterium]|uniref:DUF6894 family protein n=1 Tax=Methylobacterium TaxID=407 RepID=UPI001A9E44CE|nr:MULTISPECIES: hypothetical protein [Methylobacterium]MDR7039648.1 hypothetical protein [Methylobacterium sp. BE186]